MKHKNYNNLYTQIYETYEPVYSKCIVLYSHHMKHMIAVPSPTLQSRTSSCPEFLNLVRQGKECCACFAINMKARIGGEGGKNFATTNRPER